MKKIVKRTSSLLACLLLLVTLLPQVPVWAESVIAEGTCGESLSWSLSDDGVLTISGSGEMAGYGNYENIPWYEHRQLITNVVLQSGVTSIGDSAFYDCSSLTTITIPDSVTSIGQRAFRYCSSLTAIAIPNGVASIGDYAFYNCSSLTTITIPDSVTSIGGAAFHGCSSLTSITIPDNVTRIHDVTFAGCSSLTSITIPEGVTRIGVSAFASCSGLTSITIPDSVTRIYAYAFQNCSSLISITLPDSVTGIDPYAFQNCSSLTSITIPGSVTSISLGAFAGCSSLTSITIPGSVTSIGDDVFSCCSSLTDITFRGSVPTFVVPSYSGDNSCFLFVTATAYYPCGDESWTDEVKRNYGGTITWTANHTYENGICTGCGDVAILASGTCGEDAYWTLDAAGKLTVSGSGSMYDYSLDVWGDGLLDTPWYAHSSLITNVVIQNGVTGIGEYAFYDCLNLSSITIADSLTRIGSRAFEGCSSLTSINIPEGVTSIGERTFSGCSSLTSINIPEGVTSIVNSAFSGCSSLTSVTIPDSVTRIGASAFEFCSSLTSIAIPEGVTGIANDTFYSCENLVTVTIPESVTSIGEWAFRNCSSLPTITIPKSVTEIHNQAFCGCSSLTAITFLGSAPSFGEKVFGNVTATAHYPCGDATWTEDAEKNYGGTITWEASHTYENNFCTNCGKAAILYSGTCGEDAYWTLDAAGKLTIYGTGQMERFTDTTYVPWHAYRSMITEAVIEDGIGNVGDFAFWDCTNLTSVTIPDSVTDIGTATFCGCTALCSVTLPQNLTCINDEAFSGCDSLAAIAIPNGVTAIGEYAFSYCESLAEITFGESLQTIGEGAFVRCPVTAVTIPASVTKLGSCAFDRCGSLSSITFLGSAPAFVSNCFAEVTATAYYPCGDETWTDDVKQDYYGTITWEGSHIYDENNLCVYCQEMKIIASGNCGGQIDAYPGYVDLWWKLDATGKLTISGSGPMDNFEIGAEAPWYSNRTLIRTVEIGDGVTTIGARAFDGCNNLTSVNIPESLTKIGAFAFAGCNSLASVTIPEGVTNIGSCAFAGCHSLTSVTIPKSVMKMDDAVFDECEGLISVTILANIPTLRQYMFQRCFNLTTVVLPEGMTAIEEGAFGGCFELTSVNIPSSVTSIGWYAFDTCKALTAITIPETVTDIGDYAFSNCASLTKVTFLGSAPSMNDNIFQNVTATAYYPCGDETWTEDVKQSYGGTITWEGSHTYEAGICTVCGAADPDYVNPLTAPTISLKYPTVSFEDVILMNVYFSAENLQDVVQMGLVTYSEKVTEVSVETAGKVIPGYTWSEADGFYYVTTAGIAPKDIGNTLYFAIYYKLTDGTYGYTKLAGYSPKTYALGQLKTGSPEMKALVVAMLNYGAAAQTYFGYNTDALMNAGLTADQQALVEAYSDEMIAAVTQASGDKLGEFVDDKQYTKRYPTISFEGAFCINYYFQPTQPVSGDVTMYIWSLEDYEAAEVLTKENATKAVTMELTATGEYLAAVDGIAAKDLDKATYVTFCYSDGTTDHCGGVLGYTIGLYCKSQASQTSALADLAKACAVYGYYAGQMFK